MAAEAGSFSPADLYVLPAQDWPELRFELHASVQLLELQWAVGPVWHALKTNQEDIPAPDPLKHHILVWREGMQAQWKLLTQAQAEFVRGLMAGNTFGQLCEDLARLAGDDQAPQVAAAELREL